MNIEDAVAEFLSHCQFEKNLTEKTRKAYSTDLKQFCNFLEDRTLNSINKHVIRSFMKVLTPSARPKTVKRKVATLRAFFGFLEFEDYITVSPFRKLRIKISGEHHLPVVMTLREIKQIFSYLQQRKREHRGAGSKRFRLLVRDIAIIEMLFATGMRVSELCNLRDEDVDLESATTRIFGKGRKQRLVPLCDAKTIESLRSYREDFIGEIRSTGHFFLTQKGAPISDQTVRSLIEKYAEASGIHKKITPHTFRHTVATLLLENEMDIRNIQHLLGHSNIATTQLYAKVNQRSQRDLLTAKHPRRLFD